MKLKRTYKFTSNRPKGFSLLELTFSIAFYTFIVLTAVTSFIGIFGIYNKSQNLTRTQLQSRAALDTLVRDLRNTELRSFSASPVGPLASDPGGLASRLSSIFCLTASDGFVKAYAALYLPETQHFHLIRMQNCDTTVGYEMLIGPDTWLDDPVGASQNTPGDLANSGDLNAVPLQITQLNGGSTPKVWQVTVAAHSGSRVKTLPGQQDLVDQFSAETTLQTVVTTRK